MDEDERRYWDSQQGTPEERVKFCESLKALWRRIPDPTVEEIKQAASHNGYEPKPKQCSRACRSELRKKFRKRAIE